jgi:hypothetical protein
MQVVSLRQLLKEYLELDDITTNVFLDKLQEEWLPFFDELQDDIMNAALGPHEKLGMLLGIEIEQRA